MAQVSEYELIQDKKGMVWDLVLYIPTLIALSLVASKLWFSGDDGIVYLLVFLITFVFFIAFNRIAKTRLMILPSAPISFSVSKKGVSVTQRNGDTVYLVNDVRFFTDFAGKSFGLAGVDLNGNKQQYVFHRGQFPSDAEFDSSKAQLRIFK